MRTSFQSIQENGGTRIELIACTQAEADAFDAAIGPETVYN